MSPTDTPDLETAIRATLECAQEAEDECNTHSAHRQLATWLTELKERRGDGSPQTITEWQKAIHQYAKDKGWWDPEKPRSFGDLCALFHTEISEAFEEHRAGHAFTKVYENPDKPGKLEGVPVELADLVIRVLDFCEWAGIDLQEVMARKHAFNLTRPYRHGNKVT